MWEEIEKEKAKQRSLLNLKNNSIERDTSPTREEGRSRDIIAEKANVGSGRTYARAKIAVLEINKLKKDGKYTLINKINKNIFDYFINYIKNKLLILIFMLQKKS